MQDTVHRPPLSVFPIWKWDRAIDYDGTDDFVSTATGRVSGLSLGGTTIAVVVITDSTSNYRTAIAARTSGGTYGWTWFTNTFTAGELSLYDGTTESLFSASLLSGEPYLLVVGKASGSAIPRFHVFRFSTKAWTHANGSAAIGDGTSPGTGGTMRFGIDVGGTDPFDGVILMAAVWNTNFAANDAEVEQLQRRGVNPFAWMGTRSGNLAALWTLRGTRWTDWVGNAHESSRTGTTYRSLSTQVRDVPVDFIAPLFLPALGELAVPSAVDLVGSRMLLMGVGR